ncbi:putative B3 domain-containing protein At5g58280 [Olea europaea var. sylvestris]|uniref:B3 domain-containing At5g58280 n=1 Tax=Olea europaea subsp. europaea TaxID=158383 RepID=A0A8S0QLD7_OLEEU|nr:putative B3 domain-containing protein At5g58280 [Olea europaea var. sylvestris]CAA2966247.1 B3 domain-containing At5g58280 [Olea europaea subsp. europaea]
MANESSAKSYEDARYQTLLANKRRLEDLGILKLSKSLSDLKKNDESQLRHIRPKPTTIYSSEPRRSTRARNPVTSYRDDVAVEHLPLRKRTKLNSSWTTYLARPVEEVRTATYEEKAQALKCAEKRQSYLDSENPSFVKSMLRSHVYSCFWLGLPTKFCENHLPKTTVDIVLEDEEGSEYEAIYISKRTGLSGGWRAFALDHKLDDGDALIFELIEPTRFKVYIVRAHECTNQDDENPVAEVESNAEETPKEVKKRGKKNYSRKSKKEKSSPVLATRRSLRRK